MKNEKLQQAAGAGDRSGPRNDFSSDPHTETEMGSDLLQKMHSMEEENQSLSASIESRNAEMESLYQQLSETRADLVLLQESSSVRTYQATHRDEYCELTRSILEAKSIIPR